MINFFLFIPFEIEMCLASNPNINSVLETWIIIIFLVKWTRIIIPQAFFKFQVTVPFSISIIGIFFSSPFSPLKGMESKWHLIHAVESLYSPNSLSCHHLPNTNGMLEARMTTYSGWITTRGKSRRYLFCHKVWQDAGLAG